MNNKSYEYLFDSCKNTDFMRLTENLAQCNHCNKSYPLTLNKVILFDLDINEQNKHFDKVYGSGISSTKDFPKISINSVDFISLMDRKYYQDQFVTNELRVSYGISDEWLIERANTINKAFFDLFNTEIFILFISMFIYLIIRL